MCSAAVQSVSKHVCECSIKNTGEFCSCRGSDKAAAMQILGIFNLSFGYNGFRFILAALQQTMVEQSNEELSTFGQVGIVAV